MSNMSTNVIKMGLFVGVLLTLGGCAKCKPREIIIERVVEKQVPVSPKLPKIEKPNYKGLNAAEKLQKKFKYDRKLEAAFIGLQDINNTEIK